MAAGQAVLALYRHPALGHVIAAYSDPGGGR